MKLRPFPLIGQRESLILVSGEFRTLMGTITAEPDFSYVLGLKSWEKKHSTLALCPQAKIYRGGVIKHDGLELPFHYSRAKKEKSVLVGCTGLNTHEFLQNEEIKILNALGISVIWMALPPMKRTDKFVEKHRSAFESFMTDERSPVHRMFKPTLPRFAGGFSTGAQFITGMLFNETAKKLGTLFNFAVCFGTYLDSANASLHHSPITNVLAFAVFRHMFKDQKPHEVFLSRAYLQLKAKNESFLNEGQKLSPTLRDIGEVEGNGRRIVKHVLQQAKKTGAHLDIPLDVLYVAGGNDIFACQSTTRSLVERMNPDKAKIMEIPGGGHAPTKGHAEEFNKVAEQLKTRMDAYYSAHPELVFKPFGQRLSDGFRFTLQSSASLLNPAASFFQSRFGRRIGNTEVWRQTEGHTLNSRNAFGLQ